MRRYVVISYLILLSTAIGVVLTLGALVAPVVFHSQSLITETLSQYSQGVIMTEIFVRANYFLVFVMGAIIVYEAYDYKMGRKDIVVFVSSALVVLSIALFAFYYTPDILEMQANHTTKSLAFDQVHFSSELDFKVLLIALLSLVVRRFTKLVRAK